MQKRYLHDQVLKDIQKKMVLLGGPRQVGKTTLSESIINQEKSRYFNWDDDEDRTKILKKEFPVTSGIIVLDEIHKYGRWRNFIKGLFDKRKNDLKILITGSARLDLYRRGGDSLQGRYFFLRLLPLSVAELGITSEQDLDQLFHLGGFPEPFYNGEKQFRDRWANLYRTRLVKEDLTSLERVRELSALELLSVRLPELVGSPLSYNSLREDLQVSHNSIVRWCDIFERLYFIFRLLPFGSPKIKAVKKESKHYQLDWSLVEDLGARFENFVAVHLLKWCNFLEDTQGKEMELRFFRDQESREVDFVVTENRKPVIFIECKATDKNISPHLVYLKNKFPHVRAVQLVYKGDFSKVDKNGVEVVSALRFLKELV